MHFTLKDSNIKSIDTLVLLILAIGAGCGLIYEYLLSHYAARVLGSVEQSIFTIISIMMFFFGIGAYLARYIKNPFAGFAWVEVALALIGSTSVLLIGGIFALVNLFPRMIVETFSLPSDLMPIGGLADTAAQIARFSPYFFAALLGILIGIEIPLIARVREYLYQQTLENNIGSIYGIDYIGAGLGSLLWIFFILSMDVTLAGALTASANLLIGFIFFVIFYPQIPSRNFLLFGHILVAVVILQVFSYGKNWSATMEDMLYLDKVVYSDNTRYQHIVITERYANPTEPSILTFYINGRTQFSTNDEHIYHRMLTYPALASSARQDKVLIIGGGDGLALRDVLKWKPKKVTLIDLDQQLLDVFRAKNTNVPDRISERLLTLNKKSFLDPSVNIIINDAFIALDELIKTRESFDTIIVDLPDPSHPDLNKLYSANFYSKLSLLLAGDGAMVVQSTSPYHARNTFISIGKTIKFAGFKAVEQYRQNVPSFGEWGFTIATKTKPASQRLDDLLRLPITDEWISLALIKASFIFPNNFYNNYDNIEINRVGSMVAYQYHQQDWQQRLGIYNQTTNKKE